MFSTVLHLIFFSQHMFVAGNLRGHISADLKVNCSSVFARNGMSAPRESKATFLKTQQIFLSGEGVWTLGRSIYHGDLALYC